MQNFQGGSDEVPIDELFLTRLISETGADVDGVVSSRYDFEGGPCQNFRIESFYAEDADSAISGDLINFALRLRTMKFST